MKVNKPLVNQLEIVKRQVNNLYIVQDKIPIINDVQLRKLSDTEIGVRTGKFTQHTYPDLYTSMLFNKEYHLLLNDESIISMYYLFNQDKSIEKHNLSYIPSLDAEVCLAEEITENEKILILQNTNNYIRVDYDSTGKRDIVHTNVHMHYGIFHTEYKNECNELRIPLEGELYPNEFIYIILKYIYDLEESSLTFLLGETYSKQHRLEQCEIDKLVLSFNRNSFI